MRETPPTVAVSRARPARVRTLSALAMCATSALVLAACGSSSSSSSSSASSSSTASAPLAASSGVDQAAAATLPASIKASSTIIDGIQAPNPPMEYSSNGSSDWKGFDIDIMKALAARLGISHVQFQNQAFVQLLPSLTTHRADVVISAITDKKARQGVASFIDYFTTGAALFTSKANFPKASSFAALCGQTVEVNIGTSYIQDMQQLSSSVCAGKPAIKEITVGGTIADQELQIRTGRAIAAVTAPENIGYLGTISPGNWVPVGKVFATAPYGIAVAKTNSGLLNALDGAMKDIVSDGTYAKIAKRWNLVPSEVHSVTINAGL